MSRNKGKRTKKQDSFVMAGFVSPTLVADKFAISLASNVVNEPRLKGFTAGSGARINRVRNELLHDFMNAPKGFEWFWMLDADMILPADALTTLLHTAETQKRRLVGGLAYIFKPEQNPPFIPSILQEPTPALLAGMEEGTYEPGMMAIINEPPSERFIEAHSTGFFCMLMHRSIIKEMYEEYGDKYNNPWIDEMEQGKGVSPKGPDLEFYDRAYEATGERPLIDTSVEVGHIKNFVITHEMAQQTWKALGN